MRRLGASAIRVVRASLAELSVTFRDLRQIGRFLGRAPLGLQLGRGGEQLEVVAGDLQEDRIGRGRGIEPGLIDPLSSRQRIVDRVGQRLDNPHGRHEGRPGPVDPRAAADIHTLPRNVNQLAG